MQVILIPDKRNEIDSETKENIIDYLLNQLPFNSTVTFVNTFQSTTRLFPKQNENEKSS